LARHQFQQAHDRKRAAAKYYNLILRSALLRASRRMATSEIVPAAILRDGRAKSAASSG
jgi:hypothetical protein